MIGSRVPAIDAIYVAVIGGLLVAAAISAVKFQEAQNSIERRSQIGLALTDSYVAQRRNIATDRGRPEAAAKADAAIEKAEAEVADDAHDAKPAQNRKTKRSTTHYTARDRLVNGGW